MLRSVPIRWRRIVALAGGAVVASLPAVVLHVGVRAHVEREGVAQVQLAADKAIRRTEWRINQALIGISALASTTVESCADVDLGELRRAIMTITPVKELSIVGPDGAARCPHLGLGGQTAPVSRELPTRNDANVLLAVVRLPERQQRALRIRWNRTSEPLSLAALVPADMFLPDNDMNTGLDDPGVQIVLDEGTLLIGSGPSGGEIDHDADRIYGRAISGVYPIVANASISRTRLSASRRDLFSISAAGSLAIAVLIFGFIFLEPWRHRAGPLTEIEQALKSNQFIPYFQPVIDLRTGRIAGAEVLVRWRKPDGSIVSPGYFVPLVESNGLIVDLTKALMRAVRDQAGEAINRRPDFKVSFNLAAKHFADEAVVKDIESIFGQSQIRFPQIVFEVTERQPLDNLTAARRVIAALQGLGCKVALDDVGTGHAGLSYILKLGVDTIKIDKIFVDAIGNERHSTAIIDMLVDLARQMRIEVVAEGVENFDQVSVLREHGITLAQGFVFAPPLPMKSFLQLLETADPRPEAHAGSGSGPSSVQPAAPRRAAAA